MKLSRKYKIFIWLARIFLSLLTISSLVASYFQFRAGGDPLVIIIMLLFTAFFVVTLFLVNYMYNEDYRNIVKIEILQEELEEEMAKMEKDIKKDIKENPETKNMFDKYFEGEA